MPGSPSSWATVKELTISLGLGFRGSWCYLAFIPGFQSLTSSHHDQVQVFIFDASI